MQACRLVYGSMQDTYLFLVQREKGAVGCAAAGSLVLLMWTVRGKSLSRWLERQEHCREGGTVWLWYAQSEEVAVARAAAFSHRRGSLPEGQCSLRPKHAGWV